MQNYLVNTTICRKSYTIARLLQFQIIYHYGHNPALFHKWIQTCC